MSRLTDKEFKEILKNPHVRVIADSGQIGQIGKIGKVRRQKIIIDGHEFDSKIEALIYSEFKIDPEVEILKLQPFLVDYREKEKISRNKLHG